MAEEIQQATQPRRVDDHAGASANPEHHLAEAHNLSVRVQGKEGARGHAVWALIREEKGKLKTLAVFEGTQREAANHFFEYIHPNRATTPPPSSHRPSRSGGDYRQGARSGRPQGRTPGRSGPGR